MAFSAAVAAEVESHVELAVKRKLPMLAAFRDLTEDSLRADMMGEVAAAWGDYKPEKSAPGTFAYQVASRRLIDLWRSRSREHTRVVAVSEGRSDTTEPHDAAAADLASQAQDVYQRTRDAFARYGVPLKHPKANAGTIDRAQATAIAWVQRKTGASLRGVAALFQGDAGLCVAIGLRSTPSYKAIFRADKAVTRINFSAKKIRVA